MYSVCIPSILYIRIPHGAYVTYIPVSGTYIPSQPDVSGEYYCSVRPGIIPRRKLYTYNTGSYIHTPHHHRQQESHTPHPEWSSHLKPCKYVLEESYIFRIYVREYRCPTGITVNLRPLESAPSFLWRAIHIGTST